MDHDRVCSVRDRKTETVSSFAHKRPTTAPSLSVFRLALLLFLATKELAAWQRRRALLGRIVLIVSVGATLYDEMVLFNAAAGDDNSPTISTS